MGQTTLFSFATESGFLLVMLTQNTVNVLLKDYLISPQPVFVITCETVDNNGDGESQDEDATEGAQAAYKSP